MLKYNKENIRQCRNQRTSTVTQMATVATDYMKWKTNKPFYSLQNQLVKDILVSNQQNTSNFNKKKDFKEKTYVNQSNNDKKNRTKKCYNSKFRHYSYYLDVNHLCICLLGYFYTSSSKFRTNFLQLY